MPLKRNNIKTATKPLPAMQSVEDECPLKLEISPLGAPSAKLRPSPPATEFFLLGDLDEPPATAAKARAAAKTAAKEIDKTRQILQPPSPEQSEKTPRRSQRAAAAELEAQRYPPPDTRQ